MVKNVVYIEDDEDDIKFFKLGFDRSKTPVKLHVVRTQTELEHFVNTTSHLPDLIVMDLKLGTMNGLELTYKFRQGLAFSDAPIVILTSSDRLSDVKTAYKNGASAYVQKPTELSVMFEMINSMLKFWLDFNTYRLQ